MIRDEEQCRVTFDQLARMYSALAALERDRARFSDTWFAVMSEGPLEEIRRMGADLRIYTGRAAAEEAQVTLWLRIDGDGIEWPAAPISVLTTFLDTLRKGLQAGTEWIVTGGLSSRPTQAIQQVCDLEVLALQPGSVRCGLRLPAPRSEETVALAADVIGLRAEQLVDRLTLLGNDEALGEWLRDQIVEPPRDRREQQSHPVCDVGALEEGGWVLVLAGGATVPHRRLPVSEMGMGWFVRRVGTALVQDGNTTEPRRTRRSTEFHSVLTVSCQGLSHTRACLRMRGCRGIVRSSRLATDLLAATTIHAT